MAEVRIFDQNKEDAGSIVLDPAVFEVPARPEILHFVVRAQRAAERSGTHSTLNRAAKKGGGAKPFRQKGTGRARAGSNLSPIWTGGAVAFGPHPRSYAFKVNKKIWRLALRMAVSARLAEEALIVVKAITLDAPKTKLFVEVKRRLGLGKTLMVVTEEMGDVILAARNIRDVTLVTAEQVNVYDILSHKQLVLMEGVVERLHARLGA